jgi:thiol-disulfide isomerase/thioredoxin
MALRVRDALPSLEGATRWINGPELSPGELAGRPVFVHFWSMTCYVCHDVAGEIAHWRGMFEPAGLLFVAVHQPRIPQELDVEAAIDDAISAMNISHRAAFDNDLKIVERFDNQFVPAYYLFDREHKLRHFQAGDKSYDRIEAAIERVVAEVPQTAKA